MWAVSIGVGVAITLFFYRMSRSIVRRTYRGDAVRSKRMLEPRLTEFLAEAGHRIVVFELEGPIFFGTAEKLARQVEADVRNDTTFVILDLRRVNEPDTTGAAVLVQLAGPAVRRESLAREAKVRHTLPSTRRRFAEAGFVRAQRPLVMSSQSVLYDRQCQPRAAPHGVLDTLTQRFGRLLMLDLQMVVVVDNENFRHEPHAHGVALAQRAVHDYSHAVLLCLGL